MANSLEQLARTLINKSFDDCSEEELYNLANRYPYFAPAQFLYLKKLDINSAAYKKQYQKAILYYNDALLFEQLLNKESFETIFEPKVKEIPKVEEAPMPVAEEALTEAKEELLINPQPSDSLPTDTVITFEPFHTVDYFASLGIKLSAEDSTKDNFGKQVKSFTEWLKTMKRLPATELNAVQGKAEKQVENMAAHSVETADVITEAMADVWLQQGNKAKAKEIYRKLSLLNPSKSAYFASKIDLLKDSN